MIHKKFNDCRRIHAEKYIFVLLLFSYILGICIGSFFVMSDNKNADFSGLIVSDSSFKVLIYFILAILFKYSGVLSGMLGILPLFLGIQNSANYCCLILDNNVNKYKTALTMLKDTAIVMLLAFYIIVIINQIINKKYIFKRDLKYFFVYFIASVTIIIMESIINSIIF